VIAQAGANLDVLVDLAYGFLWYRLLVGHSRLDAAAARDLATHLIAAATAPSAPHLGSGQGTDGVANELGPDDQA
jgi:hypothetical protein